jgi:outer membrane protein TolC
VGRVDRVWNERQNTTEEFIAQGVDDFKEDNLLYEVGLEQPLPTNGRLRLGYNLQDLRNNLREQRDLEGSDEEFAGFLGLTLSQPLMKDGGFAIAFAKLELAKEDSKLALQETRRSLNSNLAGMEKAYWDLYIAQQRLMLRENAVKIAEKIVNDSQVGARSGRMAAIEEEVAAARVSLRQAQLLDAQKALDDASYRLKTFFASGEEQEGWMLRAADEPLVEVHEVDVMAARKAAVGLHPEILIREHRLRQDEIRQGVAKNQRLIRLDLEASYGYNGLGDSSDEAWSNIEEEGYPSWSVGVVARIPLCGGIRGRNELGVANERIRQGQLAVESAVIELGNQISASARQVDALFEQCQRYRQVVELNENLLEAELKLLEGGQSDSRKVLDAEQTLSEARESEMGSQTSYMQARLELELVEGTFLKERGCDPMDALPPDDGGR